MKKVSILSCLALLFFSITLSAQTENTPQITPPEPQKDSSASLTTPAKENTLPLVSTVPETSSSIAFIEPKYSTELRLYSDVYGTNMALNAPFDIHICKFILAYKFIGLGTPGFRIYAKDLSFDSTFADSFKMAAFIAPIYLYYIPFASNRPTGDVTPFASYVYLGFSGWGMNSGKLFDVGIGASCYVWDLNIGFNTVSAEGRDPLNILKNEDEDEEEDDFEDYPISWSGIYVSLTLSTGHWLSAWAKKKSANK